MQAVELSQKREQETLDALRRIAKEQKRVLLGLVARWLLSQMPDTNASREWPEMERLSGRRLSEWMELQRTAADLTRQLSTSQQLERQARHNYDSSAPLGKVSGWFVQGPPKAHIDSLASTVKSATSTREQLEKSLTQNVALRQAWAERFLRQCLSNLEELAVSPVLGAEASTALANLAAQVSLQWEAHARAERATLFDLSAQIESLKRHFPE